MTTYLPLTLAVLCLLIVFAVASAVAGMLRRRATAERSLLLGSAATLVRPLLVLVLTPGAAWLLAQATGDRSWFAGHGEYLAAWHAFWLGAAGLALVEVVIRQVGALRRQPYVLPDLLADILRGVVLILLGIVVAKTELGWDIGPLLASTALLTAVIGFALQGVLGNLLAGMSLHLTRSVQPGDWVTIDGVEGKVTRTNWRETRIQTVNHEELIVPNSKLSESVIHNMSQPSPTRRHRVDVGASYSDAPDDVIAALVEAARSVKEVLDRPAPHAVVTAFEDYGINYRLLYWTKQYHMRGWIDGQVCRHIWYKFKRRNIEIPFPMSDKLLNDFMTVVYNQRKLEPEAADTAAVVADLAASDLRTRLVVDAHGKPLLSHDDLEPLAPRVTREVWTTGETVMRQGDAGETFYVVARGRLGGTVDHGTGEPQTAFEVGAGAVVGEMSLLTGTPRAATLVTSTGCELLAFDREAFVALLGLHPDVPERLAELAAQRQAANVAAADAARAALAAGDGAGSGKAGILKRLLGFLGR